MGVHYVGDEAVTQYIESGMDGRLIQSIKSILPDTLFNYQLRFRPGVKPGVVFLKFST